LAVQSGLTSLLSFFFSPFAGDFEFAVAGVKDLLVTAFELVLGGDVSDGGVQAHRVVVFDELADDAACIVEAERGARADAFFLEDAMPAFDLAVPLHRQLHLIWTVHAKPFGSRTRFIRSMAASLRW